MASEISIYAELLQNLRQISVAASLPTPANDQTTVTVAPESITIRHDGRIAQLRLPALVAAAACGALARPSQPSADSMSWRLPLAPQQQLKPVDQTAAVPWPATDLRPGGEVRCRGCDAVVVGEGRVAEWKDLPSENWAEMMEFWHCHKPGDEEHGHSHSHGGNHSHAPDGGAAGEVNGGAGAGKADETSLASRGYGASSIISAKEGVGFVDLTSLLFVEGDCEGVLVSHIQYISVLFHELQPPCSPTLLYMFFVICTDGASKKVARSGQLSPTQWCGHRYKSPESKKSTCPFCLRRLHGWQRTPNLVEVRGFVAVQADRLASTFLQASEVLGCL